MSKLKECSVCGEWREWRIYASWTGAICALCCQRALNHSMLRDRFFKETREMVKNIMDVDIYERGELPFAVIRK